VFAQPAAQTTEHSAVARVKRRIEVRWARIHCLLVVCFFIRGFYNSF
jgi:hypothetical protein